MQWQWKNLVLIKESSINDVTFMSLTSHKYSNGKLNFSQINHVTSFMDENLSQGNFLGGLVLQGKKSDSVGFRIQNKLWPKNGLNIASMRNFVSIIFFY